MFGSREGTGMMNAMKGIGRRASDSGVQSFMSEDDLMEGIAHDTNQAPNENPDNDNENDTPELGEQKEHADSFTAWTMDSDGAATGEDTNSVQTFEDDSGTVEMFRSSIINDPKPSQGKSTDAEKAATMSGDARKAKPPAAPKEEVPMLRATNIDGWTEGVDEGVRRKSQIRNDEVQEFTADYG
jgi:hypothetical protein